MTPAAILAVTAAAVLVPLGSYPVAPAGPLNGSVVPGLLDDDEQVVAHLSAEGSVLSLSDALTLKLHGSGDYVIRMVNPVTEVEARGGDARPGLENGHITFVGHVEGSAVLTGETRLDATRWKLPLSASLGSKRSGGRTFYKLEVANLTAQPRRLYHGAPVDRQALLDAESNLAGLARIYTPELNGQAAFSLPGGMALRPGAREVAAPVPIPFRVQVTAHVPDGVAVADAGGATVTHKGETALLTWRWDMPRGSDDTSGRVAAFALAAPRGFAPLVEVSATPHPFAAAGSGSAGDAFELQYAMAALHRIGDLPVPVDRPGGGPQQVRYLLVFDGHAAPPAGPARTPRPQPLAVALTLAGLLALLAGAWFAWSRN